MIGWSALGLAGKLTAAGIALAVILAVVIWIANWDPFGSKKRLETRAATAEVQTKVEQATTQAVDRYTTEVRIIRERSDAAVQRVQEAPGADAPLPGAVRDAWLAGVRHDSGSGTDDHHSGEPPR